MAAPLGRDTIWVRQSVEVWRATCALEDISCQIYRVLQVGPSLCDHAPHGRQTEPGAGMIQGIVSTQASQAD